MKPEWPDCLAEAQDSPGRRLVDALLAVAFPPHCTLCGDFAPRLNLRSVCLPCWRALPELQEPRCSRCGFPFGSSADPTGGRTALCISCSRCLPPYAVARACGRYEGKLRELIHQFKFRKRKDLAVPLGIWMADVLKRLPELQDFDTVVPVPLHPRRQRQRGFNQALLLAREISARTAGHKLESRAMIRRKDTAPQSGLTDAQRQENTQGAFQLRDEHRIRGRKILLVDDVLTTGSTIEACCRALLEAGAADVSVFTLARVSHS